MKKKLMFLAVAAIGLAGCKGGFKQGDGGMLYNIVDKKGGTTIKEGDFVSINGIIKTESDSVLSSTYTSGQPAPIFPFPKPQFKGDLVTALAMVGEGDSLIVKINADTVAKKSGQPKPPAFKGKYYIYSIKIEKVIPKVKGQADSAMQNKIQAYFKVVSDKSKAAEPGKIQTYIDANKLKVTKTASGLMYSVTTPGDGTVPAPGDTVIANYTGKFLTGKVFDTSIQDVAMKSKISQPGRPYTPMRVAAGARAVIPGLDEGLMMVSKGEKVTFLMPSALAYGERGGGPIPPSSPLVFEIEVVGIVHPNPAVAKPVTPMMQQPANPAVKK